MRRHTQLLAAALLLCLLTGRVAPSSAADDEEADDRDSNPLSFLRAKPAKGDNPLRAKRHGAEGEKEAEEVEEQEEDAPKETIAHVSRPPRPAARLPPPAAAAHPACRPRRSSTRP